MHKPSQAVVRHLEMSSEAVGINPLEASPEETGRERGGERDHEHPEKQANTCGNKGGAMEGQIYKERGKKMERETETGQHQIPAHSPGREDKTSGAKVIVDCRTHRALRQNGNTIDVFRAYVRAAA